ETWIRLQRVQEMSGRSSGARDSSGSFLATPLRRSSPIGTDAGAWNISISPKENAGPWVKGLRVGHRLRGYPGQYRYHPRELSAKSLPSKYLSIPTPCPCFRETIRLRVLCHFHR